MTERKDNASKKSKEPQPNTQSQRFAVHLLLSQPNKRPFNKPEIA